MGKGDRPRPIDKEKYDRNYLRIFCKNKKVKNKGLSVTKRTK